MSNCPKNDFTTFHLENKNWAFVSDYIRLYALFMYGGIYLDCDYEILKSFDDLLNCDGFVSYESNLHMTNSLSGSVKGNVFFKDCIEYMMNNHKNRVFETAPIVITNVYNFGNYSLQVHNTEYFHPYNPYGLPEARVLLQSRITLKTYAIHHWAKGWNDSADVYKTTSEIVIKIKSILRRIGVFGIIKAILGKKK